MTRIIKTLLLLFSISWSFAQVPGTWTVNPSSYQNQMNVTGKLRSTCTDLNDANNVVAAFVNGQCRGVASSNVMVNGQRLAYLTVYSNTVGEKVILKIYNAATNSVLQAYDTVTFSINGLGGPTSPYVVSDNYAPTDIALSSYQFLENVGLGATIALLSATDNDAPNVFSFTLPAGEKENRKYAISGNQLLANSLYDFADPKDTVRVMVKDAKNCTYTKDIILTVTDVNDQPSDIDISLRALYDRDPAGTFVGILKTTDKDVIDPHTYAPGSCTPNINNGSFVIRKDSVFTASMVTYSNSPFLDLCIRTTDRGGLYYEKSFHIPVLDVNFAPNNIQFGFRALHDQDTAGTFVGKLTTTDFDPQDTHTYALGTCVQNVNNSSFIIRSDSVFTSTVVSYDQNTSLRLCIRTTDNSGLYYEKSFEIPVLDVNFPPSDLTFTFKSPHDQDPAGTFVGVLKAVDKDPRDTYTYAIGACTPNAGNSSVVIRNDSVFTRQIVKFYNNPSLDVCLKANDSFGLSYEKSFNIPVTDVNFAPTDIQLKLSTLLDRDPAGTFVGKLSTTDIDPQDTHIYNLCDATSPFIIQNDSLFTRDVVYFEKTPSINVCVSSADNSGLSFEKNLVVNVTDQNFAPTDILIETLSVTEGTLGNYLASRIRAVDPDTDDTFTYELVSGDGDEDNGQFYIVGDALYMANETNYDAKSVYYFRIGAVDEMNAFTEKTFTFTVLDNPRLSQGLPSVNYVSPNNDGINDYWKVQNVEIYQDFSLQIFDPFGNTVFKKENNYNNEWDGKLNGKALPDGNYFFVFKNDQRVYRGNLTIINK